MTVSDYFRFGTIFDRRRIDRLRKGRRNASRSAPQQAADRSKSAEREEGLRIPDELEPTSGQRGAASSSSTALPASSSSSSPPGLQTGSSASSSAPEQPPSQPPPSTSSSPAKVGVEREELPPPKIGLDASDDVPNEGSFLTRSNSGSNGRGARNRISSDPLDPCLSESSGHLPSEVADHPAATLMAPQGPPASSAPWQSQSAPTVLCLVGDSLELLAAPGDVLTVKGQGRFTEIGTAHGVFGHCMLVLAPPASVLRNSEEGLSLQAVWPSSDVEEIWRIRTLECTRNERGLHEAEMVIYVERTTGQFVLIGELQMDGALVLTEHETVELWQSPAELRSQIHLDLMMSVLSDMKAHEACWSYFTGARALLQSSQLSAGSDPEKTLQTVKECWKREPICTSIVIVFWQRYLCGLTAAKESDGALQALDLILRWMPLKADRGLPGELLAAMRDSGWICVAQAPRLFRPMVFHPTAV